MVDNSKVFVEMACVNFIVIVSMFKIEHNLYDMQQMLIINKRFSYVFSNHYF